MPGLMPTTPISRISVSWLAANAAAATSTNLLNRFPREVWYRRWADVTIRDDPSVI
jgi:hypothetical protein